MLYDALPLILGLLAWVCFVAALILRDRRLAKEDAERKEISRLLYMLVALRAEDKSHDPS